jgi:hypothetical protein
MEKAIAGGGGMHELLCKLMVASPEVRLPSQVVPVAAVPAAAQPPLEVRVSAVIVVLWKWHLKE